VPLPDLAETKGPADTDPTPTHGLCVLDAAAKYRHPEDKTQTSDTASDRIEHERLTETLVHDRAGVRRDVHAEDGGIQGVPHSRMGATAVTGGCETENATDTVQRSVDQQDWEWKL
jgi:hypothetical protein